jgi:D-3-phosphoglycerate dehydrogenase
MKALITDTAHPLLQEGLEKRGYACDYRPEITDAEVRGAMAPYSGLVVNSKILVDRDLLDRAPQLRWVMRLGSGLEIIDLGHAAERGVAVISSPEGNCDAVAEHALGMLLALANHFCRADRQVRRQVWTREQNRGFELMGKTIGIWGFGHTGSALGRKLAGFGVRVLAYDKYLPAGYAAEMAHVQESGPERIFAEADVLSLHLPLTPETRHLADAGFLARFARPIVLVNTSRGAVVDTEALVDALENGRLRGACLDVFENEKPATYSAREKNLYDRLFALENTLLTPHVAGWTVESKRKLSEVLLKKLDLFAKKNFAFPPINP